MDAEHNLHATARSILGHGHRPHRHPRIFILEAQFSQACRSGVIRDTRLPPPDSDVVQPGNLGSSSPAAFLTTGNSNPPRQAMGFRDLVLSYVTTPLRLPSSPTPPPP